MLNAIAVMLKQKRLRIVALLGLCGILQLS